MATPRHTIRVKIEETRPVTPPEVKQVIMIIINYDK